MSATSKGSRLQNQIAEHLQEYGYRTQTTVRRPIWAKTPAGMKVIGSKANDFFSVFDILAIWKNGDTLYVQVTDSTSFFNKINKIDEAFPPQQYGKMDIMLFAKFKNRRGVWRRASRNGNGWHYADYKFSKGILMPITEDKFRRHSEPMPEDEA